MSVSLSGGEFGFPVTFQLLFSSIEDIAQNGEITSTDQTVPWFFRVPTGYEFYPVLCSLIGQNGGTSGGTLALRVINASDDSYIENVPRPALTSTSGAYASATVSSGACRVAAGTTIAAALSGSADFANGWADNTHGIVTIFGYLREASTP